MTDQRLMVHGAMSSEVPSGRARARLLDDAEFDAMAAMGDPCYSCNGTGQVPGAGGVSVQCPMCHGSGTKGGPMGSPQ